MHQPVMQTTLGDLPVRRGKVRDIYDLGDRLLLVATDRISAFDWILPTGIPDKGRVLTQISSFWFNQLNEPHHLLSTDLAAVDLPPGIDPRPLAGRSMLVRKTEVVPIECVVRGYLSGSGWKEYQQQGSVCGIPLPAGLTESDGCPSRSSRRPRRPTAATTSTSRSIRWPNSSAATSPKSFVTAAWMSTAAGPSTPGRTASSSPTRSSNGAASAKS